MSPLAVRLDTGKEGADAVKDAELIHREHPVPIPLVQLVEPADPPDAGVVAQHVDLAEGIDGGLGSLEDGLLLGHVADDARHSGAPAP